MLQSQASAERAPVNVLSVLHRAEPQWDAIWADVNGRAATVVSTIVSGVALLHNMPSAYRGVCWRKG